MQKSLDEWTEEYEAEEERRAAAAREAAAADDGWTLVQRSKVLISAFSGGMKGGWRKRDGGGRRGWGWLVCRIRRVIPRARLAQKTTRLCWKGAGRSAQAAEPAPPPLSHAPCTGSEARRGRLGRPARRCGGCRRGKCRGQSEHAGVRGLLPLPEARVAAVGCGFSWRWGSEKWAKKGPGLVRGRTSALAARPVTRAQRNACFPCPVAVQRSCGCGRSLRRTRSACRRCVRPASSNPTDDVE